MPTSKTDARVEDKSKLSIGYNVKTLRMVQKMTTTELAEKTGVSQAQISRLENDQQGFRSGTLLKLAAVLKVRPWVLFMTQEEKRKSKPERYML